MANLTKVNVTNITHKYKEASIYILTLACNATVWKLSIQVLL